MLALNCLAARVDKNRRAGLVSCMKRVWQANLVSVTKFLRNHCMHRTSAAACLSSWVRKHRVFVLALYVIVCGVHQNHIKGWHLLLAVQG